MISSHWCDQLLILQPKLNSNLIVWGMFNFQLSDWLNGYYCDHSVGDLLVQIQDLPPTVARGAKRIWRGGVRPAVKKTKEKESYKEAKYNTSNNHSRRSRLVKEMIHKTTQNDINYKKDLKQTLSSCLAVTQWTSRRALAFQRDLSAV